VVAQLKPSKWPLRMRSPIGDGARGGGAGTLSVARRLPARGEPEGGEALRGKVRDCRPSWIGGGVVDLGMFIDGGETWGRANWPPRERRRRRPLLRSPCAP